MKLLALLAMPWGSQNTDRFQKELDLVQLCETQMFKLVLYGNMIFDTLEQSSFQKYATCWVFLALRHMLYLCICVFVYVYFCICVFDTCEYHFWYPWTILFSKICHMMGLYGTVNMLYLCICLFVFVYLCMRHLVISILISLNQELSENLWFVWSKTS